MNIQEILAKTKKKSESIITNRRPPSIATDFRPYDSDVNTSIEPLHIKEFIENQEQTDNKQATELITNYEQISNEPTTVQMHKIQIDNKLVTKVTTESTTNKQQTGNKPLTQLTPCSFSSLTGIQRAILLIIYEECKGNRSKNTREMTLEYILNSIYETGVQTTTGSIKTSLQRLESKGTINRISFKNGRGGWSQYELHDNIYRDIMAMYEHGFRNKPITNWQQTNNISTTNLATKVATMHSSSSSLNKTTTINEATEAASSSELPPDWQVIDFSSLASIGFNSNKLQQIYQAGVLTPEMVQDSIHAFAFDRDVNNKQYNNPIGFIMSLLKVKGMPYEFPQNYESPRDAALRKYVEQKQAQRERTKQLQDLLKQDAFESWLMTLSADETEKLIPPEVRKNESLRRGALLNHFQTHIWPEEEKKLTDRAGK